MKFQFIGWDILILFQFYTAIFDSNESFLSLTEIKQFFCDRVFHLQVATTQHRVSHTQVYSTLHTVSQTQVCSTLQLWQEDAIHHYHLLQVKVRNFF